MIKKKNTVGIIVILIVVGILGAYKIWLAIEKGNDNSNLFTQLKELCSNTETSPYKNPALGLSFQFNNDALVCDYQPLNQVGKSYEIYVWNKEAFFNSKPLGFGKGIIGKISINPTPGLPSGKVIKEESIVVAGLKTIVKTVRPASCTSDSCPATQMVELTYKENVYVLEEYAPGVNLFRNFNFLSK
jgi:hypothetical protein